MESKKYGSTICFLLLVISFHVSLSSIAKADYYQVLGVSRAAKTEEIKAAFNKLALKYHPDQNGGSREFEEKLTKAKEAKDHLSDPEKRRGYDKILEALSAFSVSAKTAEISDFSEFLRKSEPGIYGSGFAVGPNGFESVKEKLLSQPEKIVEILFYNYRAGPLLHAAPAARGEMQFYQDKATKFLQQYLKTDSPQAVAIRKVLVHRIIHELSAGEFGYVRQAIITTDSLLQDPPVEILIAMLDTAIKNHFDQTRENYFEIILSVMQRLAKPSSKTKPRKFFAAAVDRVLTLEKADANLFEKRHAGPKDISVGLFGIFRNANAVEVRVAEVEFYRLMQNVVSLDLKEVIAALLFEHTTNEEFRKIARATLLESIRNQDRPIVNSALALIRASRFDSEVRAEILKIFADANISSEQKHTLAREAVKQNKGDRIAIRYILGANEGLDKMTSLLVLANLYPENSLPVQLLNKAISELLIKQDLSALETINSRFMAETRWKIPVSVYDLLAKMADIVEPKRRESLREDFELFREDRVLSKTNSGKALCSQVFQ